MKSCRFCGVRYNARPWREWRTPEEQRTGLSLDRRESTRRADDFDALTMIEHERFCGCFTCARFPACRGDGSACAQRVDDSAAIAKLRIMDLHRLTELAKCRAHAEQP